MNFCGKEPILNPGSGKTTLLSILTGDHPQSYTQRAPTSALALFGAPRRTHATTHLRTRIGVVSPELYNAWPRGRNMNVWEAIATGFDGGFVPLGPRGLGVGLHGESERVRAWYMACRSRLGSPARTRSRYCHGVVLISAQARV